MSVTLTLTVMTPDGKVCEQAVREVVAPGADGLFGVRPGHAPMLAALSPGILRALDGSRETLIVIGDGLAEVEPAAVRILTGTARVAANAAEAEEFLQTICATCARSRPAH